MFTWGHVQLVPWLGSPSSAGIAFIFLLRGPKGSAPESVFVSERIEFLWRFLNNGRDLWKVCGKEAYQA
jgi:hypothetical protein